MPSLAAQRLIGFRGGAPAPVVVVWKDLMKHAVIIAHPNSGSLTHSAARAYAETAMSIGHEVIIRDLYGMDFDPRLQAAEIPQGALPCPAEDVAAERVTLSDVTVFAFIYPF